MPLLPITMRVRAARGAVNASLDSFAEQIGLSRTTLVRIESGERAPRQHELDAMARASGLPRAFFVVEDLAAALNGHDEPGLAERVAALEAQITAIRAALVALGADSLPRPPGPAGPAGTGHPA